MTFPKAKVIERMRRVLAGVRAQRDELGQRIVAGVRVRLTEVNSGRLEHGSQERIGFVDLGAGEEVVPGGDPPRKLE